MVKRKKKDYVISSFVKQRHYITIFENHFEKQDT